MPVIAPARDGDLFVRTIMAALRGRKAAQAPVWTPTPGPQVEAWDNLADETFFGGSAGGGKSDLLLGLAFVQAKNAIIFRREYGQLRALIERSRDLARPLHGRYNGQDTIWRLPGGRTVEFGAAQHADDVHRYQGRPHDFVGFDEIAHFLEAQYRFLTGWARTTDPAQRVRIVCTGNPPTQEEGEWIVRYWAPWLDDTHPHYPTRPGVLRWYAVLDGADVIVDDARPFTHKGERITPRSRTFIPARLADNPYLAADGRYEATLQALPEPLRSQLLYGDMRLGDRANPWQVVPSAWVRIAQARYASEQPPEGDAWQRAVGVDVARGGRDQTVIVERVGPYIVGIRRYPGAETPDGPAVADRVAELLGEDFASVPIAVDADGVGAAVFDVLRIRGALVTGVNNAASAPGREASGRFAFANRRAWLWWRAREALSPLPARPGAHLALPPDRDLFVDLTAPRWELTARGIQVEDKDSLRRRIGRSPDVADALCLALAAPSLLVPQTLQTGALRWGGVGTKERHGRQRGPARGGAAPPVWRPEAPRYAGVGGGGYGALP